MNNDPKVTHDGATDWIGRRVRTFRTARNTTLADLAGRAGISAAQLSRVESGDRQPSVGVLLSLSHALGVTLSELVAEEPGPPVHVVRGAGAPAYHADNGGFTPLSGPLPGLQALRLTFGPDHRDAVPASHDGEEWVHVLSGTVDLTLGGTSATPGTRTVLLAGDSAHFRSDVPHSLTVPEGADAASVLLVTTGRHH